METIFFKDGGGVKKKGVSFWWKKCFPSRVYGWWGYVGRVLFL